MKTTALFVFVYYTVISLSVQNKVQNLNIVLRAEEWEAIRQGSSPFANSDIVQHLPNETSVKTSIRLLLSDSTHNRNYVTHDNFNEKLPKIFLLLNVIYARNLKHMIYGYLYMWDICKSSEFGHSVYLTIFSQHMYRRMLMTLKYIHDLRDPESGGEDMILNNCVYLSIKYFVDLPPNLLPTYQMITQLNENKDALISFIKKHLDPPPADVVDLNIFPRELSEARRHFKENAGNLTEYDMCAFIEGKMVILRNKCADILPKLGFQFN